MSQPCLVYCRISEDREGRELGVDRQEADCRALAARLGLLVAGVYIDNDRGASTRSRKPRPEYRRMLATASKPGGAVIISYTSSRLTRRPRENEDLIDLATNHGVRYEYVRSPSFDLNTSAGRRVARILAAQDAGESEDIAERVGRDVVRRARDGVNHGGRRAFGYGPGGIDLVPAEAAEVKGMFGQLLTGLSQGAIVRDLTEREVPTVTGKPWGVSTLRGMLMNPRYAGLRAHRGEIVGPAKWPAIVTEDVWRAACGLLADPDRRMSTGNRASYLLSGLALCGVCGDDLRQTVSSSGSDHPNRPGRGRQYTCRPTRHLSRRMDWVDEYVTDVILARVSRDDAVDLLIDNARPNLAELRLTAQGLRERLNEFAADRAAGLITRAQMLTGTEKTRAHLAEIEPMLASTHRSPLVERLVTSDDPRGSWSAMTLDEQRAVVATLVTVVLYPGGRGKRGFDPSKVDIRWNG